MSVKDLVKEAKLTPVRKPRESLGDYTLIAELARGGMGRVYLARRVGEAGFERLYAIKLMHEHMTDDPEAILMLLDEANIASQLHHPNVVPIVDIGADEGTHYVVMDYVEGASFYQVLARNRMTRHPRLVVPVVIDALRGLHAAHELRDDAGDSLALVHRDFSPHNLLVGTDGICRVTDFGVAKARARFTHTESRMQKGKLAYMAPEQLAADADLDRRVDIWAAGVVLWYALTGQHPFKGKSEALTIRNIIGREVPLPSRVGLRPPSCLDEICMKALERDRESRFETAEAMANELQKTAIRNDLLAPASQVGAWVMASFRYELEARRKTLRAVRGEADVSWIGLPVMPHMTVTPSTGGHEVSSVVVHVEVEPRDVPEGQLSEGLARERKDSTGPTALEGVAAGADPGSDGPPALPEEVGDPAKKGRAGPPDDDRAATEVAETARPAPHRQPSRRRWLAVGGGVVVVAVLCYVAFTMGRATTADDGNAPGEVEPVEPAAAVVAPEPPTETKAPSQASPPPGEAPAELAAAAEAAETPPRSGVQVVMEGLPDGARVRLDGRVVVGPSVTVPRDGRRHVLRVEAEGFRSWQHTFTAEGDTTVEVRLHRAREKVRTPAEGPSGIVRDPGF